MLKSIGTVHVAYQAKQKYVRNVLLEDDRE